MPDAEPYMLTINLDTLTPDEIAVVNLITGATLDAALTGEPTGRTLVALAVIAEHRRDPEANPISNPMDIAATGRKAGTLHVATDRPRNPVNEM